MTQRIVERVPVFTCSGGEDHDWHEESGGWVGCTKCPALREEFYYRFNEGVELGERRAEDLYRQRRIRTFLFGFIVGVLVGVIGYIEVVSTIITSR